MSTLAPSLGKETAMIPTLAARPRLAAALALAPVAALILRPALCAVFYLLAR